jgi:hypothetical protein
VLAKEGVDRRVGPGWLTLLARRHPAARDLDVDVGLCPSGELIEHVMFADGLGDRVVDVVVPAGGRLLERDVAVLLEGHEVFVAEDMAEDLVVATEAAAFETSLRPGPVQLCRLEKG